MAVTAIAATLLLAPCRAADVHVAPTGDDAADGATGRPVASLRRALDRVREIRAAGVKAGPVVVEVADGRHELRDTLVISADDSGTAESPTVIRAAAGTRPLVSGGVVIAGWEVSGGADAPRWRVTLPEVKGGDWTFAQLFVNDQRRFRPTVPAAGWATIAGELPPSAAAAGKGHDRFEFAGDDLRGDWHDPGAVEVVAVHRWTMSRLPIGTVERHADGRAGGVVTLAGHTRALTAWCSFPKGNRFRAENVREALGSPGSWYLDRRSGELTYCPLPGESPDAAVVVAPRLPRLVEIRGDAARGRAVEHLRIEGLAFAHDNWTLPAGGQSYPQAEINVGAAIVMEGARGVVLDRVAVRHTGRYAVDVGAGCHGCRVEHCEFVDLGGGGLLVGIGGGRRSWSVPGRAEDGGVSGTVISDCTIAHGGRLHPAAVGVWIGHATETTVEHCDIHDLTYTGVSVGWTWGYTDNPARGNRIRENHIHDLGQGVLSDLGGVYTLGVSPGTVVEGNVIHHVSSRDYGGWGLYTDEGSTGIVMRQNLVFRTTSGGFHQHYGRDNRIENNVFAAARDWQLQRTKVEDHVSFAFERNIVWWNSPAPLVRGDWTKGLVTARNCYWNAAGPVAFPGGGDLAARQAAGQDEGSIVADPKFADPSGGDFALAADSPVRALGFEPLDPARAGRRTPRTLTADLPTVPSPWPEAQERRSGAEP